MINDVVLSRENVYKDLGIYFDTRLNFQQHVDFIQSKTLRVVNFIKRDSREVKSVDTFRKIYNSKGFRLYKINVLLKIQSSIKVDS